MRKALVAALLVILTGLSYMAWPMISAWQLKRAIMAGDLKAIEQKVDWPALRASLKASLVETAGAKPWQAAQPASGGGGTRNGGHRAGPSFWQRLKSSFVPGMIETSLNQMMTPAGLARAYATRENYRRKWRPAVGFAKPARALDGTWLEGTRLAKFIDTFDPIARIVFTSFTRLEIEVIDRYQPDRHFITVMQLENFHWKLAGLRLLPLQVATTGHAAQ